MKSKILDGTRLLDEEIVLAKGQTTNKEEEAPRIGMKEEEEELPDSLEGLSKEAKEQAYSTLSRILWNRTGGYALHERIRALFALKNIADDEAVSIVCQGIIFWCFSNQKHGVTDVFSQPLRTHLIC